MSNLVPVNNTVATTRAAISRPATKALAKIEEGALLRSAEIMGVAYVGQTALRAVAEVSMAEAELGKLIPGAQLRLAAIGDAVTAAIQARVLEAGRGS